MGPNPATMNPEQATPPAGDIDIVDPGGAVVPTIGLGNVDPLTPCIVPAVGP